MIDFEVTIIGAGIIGLSIARELSQNGKNVLIIEKNKSFGEENSSRNSGVIHAGVYYKNKTLKDKLCAKGNLSLYSYAKERKINFSQCGKLIVACSSNEKEQLLKIKKNAERNNIKLHKLSKKLIQEFEPNLNVEEALLSDRTGIIDVHELMTNFIADIENKGGIINYNTDFSKSENKNDHISFYVDNDFSNKVKTQILINCAGLKSQTIAKRIDGLDEQLIPKIRFVKGNYMSLSGHSPFKKLIYPIPEKDGLGIHSTINLQGKTIFGPDTVNVDGINFKMTEGITEKFQSSISRYWPGIKERELNFDYCGIRPKTEINDFIFLHKKISDKLFILNLFGIESPGLTSCIQIGKYVKKIIEKQLN